MWTAPKTSAWASSTGEHARERVGDAGDLALGQRREERERERALGDVLADRELARPVAEALSVEAHQVDRRQVGLGLHTRRPQARHDVVARDAARQLDDEDEPAAHVAARVLARQLEALDPGQRGAVALGHP